MIHFDISEKYKTTCSKSDFERINLYYLQEGEASFTPDGREQSGQPMTTSAGLPSLQDTWLMFLINKRLLEVINF